MAKRKELWMALPSFFPSRKKEIKTDLYWLLLWSVLKTNSTKSDSHFYFCLFALYLPIGAYSRPYFYALTLPYVDMFKFNFKPANKLR